MVFCGGPRFDFSDRVRLALGADRRTSLVQTELYRSANFFPPPRAQLGDRAVSILPTLCWFNSSDAFLPFSLCRRSCVVAASYFWHRAALSLVGLVIFYLSLRNRWPKHFSAFSGTFLLCPRPGSCRSFLAPWQLGRNDELIHRFPAPRFFCSSCCSSNSRSCQGW